MSKSESTPSDKAQKFEDVTRDLGDVIETKDQLTKSIVLGMNRMFENTKAHPWFIPVYFKYRGAHGVVGQAIADVEQDYISRQAFSWQNGELSKKSDQTDVMKSIEHWMSELFMA